MPILCHAEDIPPNNAGFDASATKPLIKHVQQEIFVINSSIQSLK